MSLDTLIRDEQDRLREMKAEAETELVQVEERREQLRTYLNRLDTEILTLSQDQVALRNGRRA